jgi:hypothetical protein
MQGVDENEIRRIAALSLDELRTEFLVLVEAMRALLPSTPAQLG